MSAVKTTGRNMIEAINDAHRVMVRGNFTKYDGENGTSSATNRATSCTATRTRSAGTS